MRHAVEGVGRIAREALKEPSEKACVQWSEAYPLRVFPEPNWKRAADLLRAGGSARATCAMPSRVLRRIVQWSEAYPLRV
jgi:hypothetical protein